jgi:dolichol kinase
MDIEIKRQIIHACGVFTILLVQIFDKWNAAVLTFLIAAAFFLLAKYRQMRKKTESSLRPKVFDEFEDYLENGVKNYERPKELPLKGAITFYTGCFLSIALFQPNIAIASITILALADSLSTIIGKFFGKHKLPINKEKSWEGSITFFIASLLILIFFIKHPLNALVIGIITTLVEMLPRIDDNITVPLTVGILMSLI